MNKEVSKNEPVSKPKVESVEINADKVGVVEQKAESQSPALEPHVLAAIQAAVQSAVTTIVQTMSVGVPQSSIVPPGTNLPPKSVPQVNTGQQPSYVTKLKGIPVEPGQDLRHVHPSVINNWFNNIENRWKENYNKKAVGGLPVNLSWTRG